MLASLVSGLLKGACQVSVALDSRFYAAWQRHFREYSDKVTVALLDAANCCELETDWIRVSQGCELVIVIAPECEHVLLEITEVLRASGATLINCSANFLTLASDKVATARLLSKQKVGHPPTRRVIDVDEKWLDAVRPLAVTTDQSAQWVLKPADGAGCQGLCILTDEQLEHLLDDREHIKLASKTRHTIVQPWLRGRSLSCSAVVDVDGNRHWLPLVSQDFHPGFLDGSQRTIAYGGCSLPPNAIAAGRDQTNAIMESNWELLHAAVQEVLNAAIDALGEGALGWIGVDLLYEPTSESWSVIEVNPRCTSSLTGLAQAYSGNLPLELVRAGKNRLDGLQGRFYAIRYDLNAVADPAVSY